MVRVRRSSAYVDALSNWYVRRSRDRFWASDKQDPDKLDAYWTLYECLLATTKMIAPFVPFLAESLWQNLALQRGLGVASYESRADDEQSTNNSRPETRDSLPESVHLCDYPEADTCK